MEPKFKVGDVVSLRSGGPDMTVREMNLDNTLSTVWFDEYSQLQEGYFGFEELEMRPRLV